MALLKTPGALSCMRYRMHHLSAVLDGIQETEPDIHFKVKFSNRKAVDVEIIVDGEAELAYKLSEAGYQLASSDLCANVCEKWENLFDVQGFKVLVTKP